MNVLYRLPPVPRGKPQMAILTWAVVTDFRVLLVLTGLFGMGALLGGYCVCCTTLASEPQHNMTSFQLEMP